MLLPSENVYKRRVFVYCSLYFFFIANFNVGETTKQLKVHQYHPLLNSKINNSSIANSVENSKRDREFIFEEIEEVDDDIIAKVGGRVVIDIQKPNKSGITRIFSLADEPEKDLKSNAQKYYEYSHFENPEDSSEKSRRESLWRKSISQPDSGLNENISFIDSNDFVQNNVKDDTENEEIDYADQQYSSENSFYDEDYSEDTEDDDTYSSYYYQNDDTFYDQDYTYQNDQLKKSSPAKSSSSRWREVKNHRFGGPNSGWNVGKKRRNKYNTEKKRNKGPPGTYKRDPEYSKRTSKGLNLPSDPEKGQEKTKLYTKWSKWSRCSRQCQQTRRRRCRAPSVCGTAIIKEKRKCVGWRCQPEKFHLIKPEEISSNLLAHSLGSSELPAPRADVRVLLNYNSMFYTKWSQWSACSKNCLTSRYRSCRYPLFCGNAVIREEVYCYIQSTACEMWYIAQKPKNKENFHSKNVTFAKNDKGAGNSGSSKYQQQVVFGQNQFFTENLPVSPEDNAHILNINVGNHRFSSGSFSSKSTKKSPSIQNFFAAAKSEKKNPSKTDSMYFNNNKIVPSNEVVVSFNKHRNNKKREHWKIERQVESKPDELLSYGGNRKKWAKKYGVDREIPKENSIKMEREESVIKRGRINNVFHLKKHANQITSKEETFRTPLVEHLQTLLEEPEDSLPKECGRSSIKKSPWDLRIIGGRESAPDKWPWQVAILNRFKELFCGGTLVAAQWVLTAAHCLRKKLYVRLAEHDLALDEGREIEFKITETIPHPLYDSTTVDNDVALIRLPEPVDIGSKIAPVCVPKRATPLPVGQQCTIIGWGKERRTNFFGTEVLNEAEVPVIDEDFCRKVYSDYYITQNMFCAGHRKGRIDSCAGDSGGPLLCHQNGQWYIYGITSFGEGCGRRGKFGIYARVSNYRSWINDIIASHSHRNKFELQQSRHNNFNHRRHARNKKQYKNKHRRNYF